MTTNASDTTRTDMTTSAIFPSSAPSDPDAPHVTSAEVSIRADRQTGDLTRIWESIGYDEIN